MNVTPKEFTALREAMGWPTPTLDTARRCVESACFLWGARDHDGTLAGLVRVVGDGVLTFYVADVMVRPTFRGRGIGDALMKRLVEYLRSSADPGAMVLVVPIRGREPFYERYGFTVAPRETFGDGMLWHSDGHARS